MACAPIVLFVYNRADHFLQTFRALSACEEAKESDLYIFADGPKNEDGREKVEACRAAVRSAVSDCPFRNVFVTEAPANRGLAASVISGVTEVLERCGRAIVVEDDSVVSPYFLKFMNGALDVFSADRRVGAVAGYTPAVSFPENYTADIFTCWRSCSSAWATWADRWQNVDWELKDLGAFCKNLSLVKKLNADGTDRFLRLWRQAGGGGSSWSVRFGAHLVKNDMLTVYPRYSLVRNIGCDETGVHSTASDAASMAVDLSKAIPDPKIEFIPPDKRIGKRLRRHYSGGFVSDIKRFAATVLIVLKGRLK